MEAKILAKLQKNTFLDKFLKKTQESKVCPKKVGLFQFKVGWFKIKARTNLGPQNYMYLSAPERLSEAKERKGWIVTLLRVREIGWKTSWNIL